MAGYDLGTAWRIIPARAGFTYTPPRSVEIDSDHPRSRGVYCPAYQGGLLVGRIIPARAGFTLCSLCSLCPPSDHPRSRGVYLRAARQVGRPPGSSPLARGLLTGMIRAQRSLRIIPARAGFTTSCPWLEEPRRDHPRSRGVYPTLRHVRRLLWGSSPLARGLLLFMLV